jgi:transcriptional regulator with XRE-family HTH domain
VPRSTASGTSLEDESNAGWIDRQTRTPEARRLYEQERLVLWVSEALAQAMAESGLSKADLAEKLGTSRAHITQVLSGSRNMTLRTVADLAWACNQRAEVQMGPLEGMVNHEGNATTLESPRESPEERQAPSQHRSPSKRGTRAGKRQLPAHR